MGEGLEVVREPGDAGDPVFALDGQKIAGITGFPHDLELFTQLGLPLRSTS